MKENACKSDIHKYTRHGTVVDPLVRRPSRLYTTHRREKDSRFQKELNPGC